MGVIPILSFSRRGGTHRSPHTTPQNADQWRVPRRRPKSPRDKLSAVLRALHQRVHRRAECSKPLFSFLPLLSPLRAGWPSNRHEADEAPPLRLAHGAEVAFRGAGPREQGENGPRQRVSDPGSDRLSTARGTHEKSS